MWMLSVVRIGLSKRIGCTIVRGHDRHAFTELTVFFKVRLKFNFGDFFLFVLV